MHVREQAEAAQLAVEVPAHGLPACVRSAQGPNSGRSLVRMGLLKNLTRERIPVLGVGLVVARKAQHLVQH